MTLKFTDLQQRLKEAQEKKIVFSFGRMNPPTIGHEKLVNKIKSEAKARGADARLYLSHTSNKEKDPLTYNEKAKYAKKAFGIFKKSRARTIIEVAKELEADGYTDITLVFGEDRDAEMVNLIKRYNGKDFNFNSINSVSAGKRDPNAKGVEGISGTKLRELAKTGKLDLFKQALASKLSDREKTAIYNQIRKVYSISDDVMFDRDELREAYLMGEFFNVGDIVYDMNEETEYEIIEQGPNFVYCKGEDGNVYTKWLSDLSEKKKKDDEDRSTVRQDKDIADKSGTQPAKYYKGIKSKSTKSARDAHFKKGAKKSDDDPSAYEPAPGDATAKTKPSKHTKKFKQMFGEVSTDEEDNPRIARKKGQPANSDKHSDLYTDENPKGTIHGLKFATVEDAKASVKKIEGSGRKHAHKIQAAIAMEQRARVMGKTGPADVYRAYINKMKKKTKEMNEDAPNTKDAMARYKSGKAGFTDIAHLKAKGLIPRADGTKRKSDKYEAYEIGKDYADHTKEVTPGQSVGEKTYLRRHKTLKNLKVPVTKKSGRIIKKGDKPFKDEFEIDERTLTPAEKEKMKKYEKDIDKQDFIDRYGEEEGPSIYYATITKMAKGESLWDNIRKKRERIEKGSGEKMRKVGDKGAPTPDQMARAKAASEDFSYISHDEEDDLRDDWNIDIFLEEEVDIDNDEELATDLEGVIDGYDELEDVEDIYPDLDKDGDHDDEDWSNMSSDDGMQRTVIDDNYDWVDEVLTPAQRFKRSQQMRRLKGKIARARKIALRRPSSPEKLQKRAQRHARNLMRKRYIKGKNYNDLSFAEKQAIEKRLQGKGALISRIAIRLKPKLKKLEQQRLKSMNKQESRLIESNIYRVGSEMYYETFNDWKKTIDRTNLDYFDKELLETDIGSFAMYEGNHVPLDCPMIEEEKQPELNKPKAGGPKKYYVYVKDPKSGNVKKVSWGDTTGLKIKLNDPEARKSFSARHNCPAKKDKTKPGYWACRMPYYAKQLGLSGGGNFFW